MSKQPLLGNNVLNQIAIVVNDLEAARAAYAQLLGIPQPDWFIAGPPQLTQVVFRGQPTNSESKLCFIPTSSVQIELIEPNQEPSTMREFLNQVGEGVHHLAFDVDNLEQGLQMMKEQGYELEQKGNFVSGKGRYAYVDTRSTYKTIIELLERENKYDPLPPASSERKERPLLGTNRISQIGIVVRDLEEAAKAYGQLLGVELPDVIPSGKPEITQVVYQGQPTEAKARFMFIDTPLIQVELIEPGDSPSTWQEELESKGEGVHHISFVVDDLDEQIACLAELGYSVIQRGNFWSGKGRYAYIDTRATFKVIMELLEKYDA